MHAYLERFIPVSNYFLLKREKNVKGKKATE